MSTLPIKGRKPSFKKPTVKSAPEAEEQEQETQDQSPACSDTTLAEHDAALDRKTEVDPRIEFAEMRAALFIDKNALDDEVIQQPALYHNVSEAHAMAVGEREAAKEALASLDAKLGHALRSKWSALGDKFTDKRIADEVQMHAHHIVYYAHLSYLTRRAAYLQALKDAFDQRAKLLRDLTSLYVSGYFTRTVAQSASNSMRNTQAEEGRQAMANLRTPLSQRKK